MERVGTVVDEDVVGLEAERAEGEGEGVDEGVELAEGGPVVDEGGVERRLGC